MRLRKALNTIRAIESIVAQQKRMMKQLVRLHRDNKGSDVEAKFNFCRTQVRDYERKRLQLIEDVEAMNSIVLDMRLPIFNFPKPSWHIDAAPIIKVRICSYLRIAVVCCPMQQVTAESLLSVVCCLPLAIDRTGADASAIDSNSRGQRTTRASVCTSCA